MSIFKDALRLVGVALLLYGAWQSNVAAAIAGGAFYSGGFGDQLAFSRLLPRRSKPEGRLIALRRETKTG